MQTFKDREGHEWEIDLVYVEIERIKAESQDEFDLFEPQKNNLGQRLDDVSNLALFWKLLWHIVQPQAGLVQPTVKELRRRGNNPDAIPSVPGITAAEFGLRMASNCLMDARAGFFIEWRDFFHQIQRPDQAMALEALITIHAETLKAVRAKVESNPQMQELPELVGIAAGRALAKPFSDLQHACTSIRLDTPIEDSGNATTDSPATPEQS